MSNRLSSPLPDPLDDLTPALGATGRLSILRDMPSRPLLSSTLLEKMDSALLLASGDLNPSFLNVLFLVSGITVRGSRPVLPASLLSSVRVPKVLPLSVRSVVTGRTPPLPVLTTGDTTTEVLVTGSMILLLTIAILVPIKGLFTTTAPPTTTVVVKLWLIKKPGNQKPNHQVGYGTQL